MQHATNVILQKVGRKMVDMNAIYIHGLGSGASTSAVKTISRLLPQYKWHALEMNENLKESVAIIDDAVKRLQPNVLMGTSLGGLYIMFVDLSSVPWCRRIICNPACNISQIIREKIGFGVKEYFVPRKNGIQQYELNEELCKAFERDGRKEKMMRVRGYKDYAVFSIHDELIGSEGILANMVVCQELGYKILLDDKGGHRLDKNTLEKIKDVIFANSTIRIDEYRSVYRIPNTRFYTFHSCIGKGIVDSDGVILVPSEMDEIDTETYYNEVFALKIRKGDKYGLFDWRGIYVEPKFEDMEVPDEGWVKVYNGNVWGWIDIDGNFTDDQSKAEFGCWIEDESYALSLT